MASIMDHDPRNVCVFGNSSLNIMYDLVSHGFFARLSRREAWRELKDVSWLCPVPGYDRHFAITELFGIKMIPVRMNENGPDMDEIKPSSAKNGCYQGNMVRPPVL